VSIAEDPISLSFSPFNKKHASLKSKRVIFPPTQKKNKKDELRIVVFFKKKGEKPQKKQKKFQLII
jgi:hypothetical protein